MNFSEIFPYVFSVLVGVCSWRVTYITLSMKVQQDIDILKELKKSEDIARSIAEFLVNIADMKNPDIDNVHEAIYQRIQMYA